jgi:hypothetical protein
MSITLLAFGRRGYAIATSNMVLSLRHHGYRGRINLHCTEDMESMLDDATKLGVLMHRLSNELASDPGKCKASLPTLIRDDATLYLDVDGIAMKDVTPLVQQLMQDERPILAQAATAYVVGGDARPQGHWWVAPKTIIERHGLKEGDRIFAVNTSAVWMRKGDALDAVQRAILEAHAAYSHRDLVHKWGGAIPDELCLSAACAVLGLDPTMPETACYFDRSPSKATQVAEAAYILPLYGSRHSNGCTSPHKRDIYDGQIRIMRGRAEASRYASRHIMAHKFIDQPMPQRNAVSRMPAAQAATASA